MSATAQLAMTAPDPFRLIPTAHEGKPPRYLQRVAPLTEEWAEAYAVSDLHRERMSAGTCTGCGGARRPWMYGSVTCSPACNFGPQQRGLRELGHAAVIHSVQTTFKPAARRGRNAAAR